jgi:hypothetical protein
MPNEAAAVPKFYFLSKNSVEVGEKKATLADFNILEHIL